MLERHEQPLRKVGTDASPEVLHFHAEVFRIGHAGAHDNPAGVLLQNDLRQKTVVASVTGTEQDPQVWSRQVALLREAGVLVAPSNAHAAELAAAIVS